MSDWTSGYHQYLPGRRPVLKLPSGKLTNEASTALGTYPKKLRPLIKGNAQQLAASGNHAYVWARHIQQVAKELNLEPNT